MLKNFPLGFVHIALLVRIGNNSWSAFHEETISEESVSEQPPHWPLLSPRYLKVDSTWKLSFLMLTSLKDAKGAGAMLLEHLWDAKFLLSLRWSVFPEHLLWTYRSYKVHEMEFAPTLKEHTTQGYFGLITEILSCSAFEIRILVLSTFTNKPCDSSEIFQAASGFKIKNIFNIYKNIKQWSKQ